MTPEQFITEKYESNNWGLYPPSRRLVTEWLKEYADQQLILHGVSKSFYCWEKDALNQKCESVCDVCRGSKLESN